MSENEKNTFSVRLVKRHPHGLGFLVRKRKNNPPLVVSDLVRGGAAEQSGLIKISDLLMAVNGVHLVDIPYNTALEVLRSVPYGSPCVLVLRAPEGYNTRIENVVGPDGAIRIVRYSDSVESDSTPPRKISDVSTQPMKVFQNETLEDKNARIGTWPRNYPAGIENGTSPTSRAAVSPVGLSYRSVSPHASPLRNPRRRYSSQSPVRRRISPSPVRWRPRPEEFYDGYLDRDTDTVLAWNGVVPREIYEIPVHEDIYGGTVYPDEDDIMVSPPSDRYCNVIENSKGLQWPEQVIVPNDVVENPGNGTSECQDHKWCSRETRGCKTNHTEEVQQEKKQRETHINGLLCSRPTDLNVHETKVELESTTTDNVKPIKEDTKEKFQCIKSTSEKSASEDVGTSTQQSEPKANNDTAGSEPKCPVAEIVKTDSSVQTVPLSVMNSSAITETAQRTTPHGSPARRFIKLQNYNDGKQFNDTLHQKSIETVHCTEKNCWGSVMFPPARRPIGTLRPKAEVLKHAIDFINQYYAHIKRTGSPAHKNRLAEVQGSIEKTGTYNLTETELMLGAKTAWRNAPRCIGRIQWTKLQVFDARNICTAREMFQAICNHISYGTNKGNLRSAITVFPNRTDGKHDFRVWNPQLIMYAGYRNPDGSITGDPATVEFTELCIKFGWKAGYGRFDILPLVLSANGEDPEMFDIPPELILEVEISHPKYPWFAELGLRWYALPAVSALMLDLGGLEFTGCPFNGWYMGTEIASRDFCDSYRLNMLETVGKKMGLDTNANASLWKDRVLVEVNYAVLYSFQKKNITITDHHTASESFMKHLDNEQRLRGGCPADWVWVVPPMSGSITPVFHQEMLSYLLKPSYEYQEPAWVSHVWKNKSSETKPRKRRTFKEVAKAVKFSASLMGRAMAKRFKATILFATETGKSENYAKILKDIFNHAFDARVMCMDEYDVAHLEHETLLLVVTSTFGNGDAPENGENFGRYLVELGQEGNGRASFRWDKFSGRPKPKVLSRMSSVASLNEASGVLANVRYSVFGLGSTAYPNFCAFARALDSLLGEVGGERICEIGEGDELCGQEQSFKKWATEVFKSACDTFGTGEGANISHASSLLNTNDGSWSPARYRVVATETKTHVDLCAELSKVHSRQVLPCKLISSKNLQTKDSSRSTILIVMDTQGASELLYEPGDHTAIFPANEDQLVNRILAKVDDTISHNEIVIAEFLEERQTALGKIKNWSPLNKIPPCSLVRALKYFFDITTPPSPAFLRLLSTIATDEKEKELLSILGKGAQEYDDWKFGNMPNLAEILEQFSSVKLPASFFLTQLPVLKPRYYSISSSLGLHQGQIHATVAVVSYVIKGNHHNGVCSTWLNSLKEGDVIPNFIRSAPAFHMPEDKSVPFIMVGPGTGIAPFRSFWQQRYFEMEFKGKESSGKFGDMYLVFGCRHSTTDNIYKLEKSEAHKKGVIKEVLTALSREPGQEKKYVQDVLLDRAADVFDLVNKHKGHIYVCGDVSMAEDVCKRLEIIVQKQGKLSPEQAKEYVSRMKDQVRYHEDIFGVTLKTSEVTEATRKATRRALLSASKLISVAKNSLLGSKNTLSKIPEKS
ncbi:nitric oxide synthase, brain-like [Anneissia japonica]|uniref:nitric oxide synthase, brain-like n=1 Tax=Anneissia japonica TaxID=1529436 RepID=UPI0014258C25|nr:nitric oxide synthase, brain-like [Anneissia japonica]